MPVPPFRRPPGSQIAPGQRPFNSDAPTASTHNKRPIHELTDGRLYRVRDKDWAVLWVEGLLWEEANLYKERLVAERRSTTARVEDMAIPPPAWYTGEEPPAAEHAALDARHLEVLAEHLAREIADMVAANPVTTDDARDVLERWIGARIVEVIASGDNAVPDPTPVHEPDPYLSSVQERARAAVLPLAQAANARQATRWTPPKPRVVDVPTATPVRVRPQAQPVAGRVVPRDKTIVAPKPRTAPPPRDKTVASEIIRRAAPPDAGEPTPMMSPLKAAMLPDELELPDGSTVLDEGDLSDLLTGVGGGPSDEDHMRAKAQAEKDRLEREQAEREATSSPEVP